jgi:hypothetical protein
MANLFKPDITKPQWCIHLESALLSHVPAASNDVPVMKLPSCYRVPSELYTPRKWFFGLHNRDVPHARESEDLKIALAAACALGPFPAFCASVVDNPVDAVKAYGLDHGDPMFCKEEVQYLLTLDALTIFFVFAENAPPAPPVATPPAPPVATPSAPPRNRITDVVGLISNRKSWGYAYLPIDLLLFENQITLALLKKVITTYFQKRPQPESPGPLFERIVKHNVLNMCAYLFELTADLRDKFDSVYPHGQLEQCAHIVACVHRILCGDNWQRKSQQTTIIVQSATSLKKAGIRIKGIKGVLDKVDFRKGCLFLPIIRLYDQTESQLRNLAMYEFMNGFNSLRCPFGEYLQLMTDLIREEGDVKHLIDCGVIQNGLATDNNAFQMWSNLQSELVLPEISKEYAEMVSEINKQCKSKLNVMRTEFYQLFCSRPWYVFGVITATIVTVGTCIQAYTAVIGSDKMQPHFPP